MSKIHHFKQRVGKLIQRELSQLLYRNVSDPRLNAISITYVDISKDLRHASVGFVSFNQAHTEAVMLQALEGAKGRLRYLLANKLNLRVTPVLHFRYDKFFIESGKLHTHINQVFVACDEEFVQEQP